MNIYDRINVSMTHSRLSPLCFDRLLDRKSTATISLKELHQLYQQSRTEKERDQCFNSKILDRLRTNNFNELVRMNMDPENDQFFANHKILHSIEGKIVLERENEPFSKDFYQKFLSLIDSIAGNLLLTFVDVKTHLQIMHYDYNYAGRCAETLSRKLQRGEKVFLMDVCETISHDDTHAFDISSHSFVRYNDKHVYLSTSNPNSQNRTHSLWLPKANSGTDTETLIAMINEDRFVAAKQYLVSVLPMVKAAELSGGGRSIFCDNCGAMEKSDGDIIEIEVDEPDWSNCAGCAVK